MPRPTTLRILCFTPFALLLTASTARPQQQAGTAASSGKLELTSSSDVAKREYRAMYEAWVNLYPERAREHANKALAADPGLGLAQLFLVGGLSPQLTTEQRAAEASKAFTAASAASVTEVMFALYAREAFSNRAQSALTVIRALAPLVPQDADVAYQLWQQESVGKTPTENERTLKAFVDKFPDYPIAYNTYAYMLHGLGDHSGDVGAVQQYVRLAPTQPNAHDTWADLEILHGHLDAAATHVEASLTIDSAWRGRTKLGGIKLATGKAADARDFFTREMAAAPDAAAKVDLHHWIAATYIYNRDGKNALRELSAINDEAVAANLPANSLALPHQRMALVEALFGNKQNVAAHLAQAAQIQGASAATQAVYLTLASGAAGDVKGVQDGAIAFAKTPSPNVQTMHTLNAYAAMAVKNYTGAEAELAQANPTNLLVKAMRAELLKQKGKTAEARALRDEVLKVGVKNDGNGSVDVAKLVAKLRVEKL